jgi:malonyl-CoA O-methyltransferase
MALHFTAEVPALLARWHRALAVDGFLMFSTLGPYTLRELAALYEAAGWGPPAAPLIDMHDLGDALVQAGFADPVMDQEMLTLTWSSPDAALAELRQLGGNAHRQRLAGLRTPRWRARLLDALAARADAQGRIALGFELVYGHAFRPAARAPLGGPTGVPVDELRRSLARRRGPGTGP